MSIDIFEAELEPKIKLNGEVPARVRILGHFWLAFWCSKQCASFYLFGTWESVIELVALHRFRSRHRDAFYSDILLYQTTAVG